MSVIDRFEGEIWYDGEFVPWEDAKLHVLSHGLHYASAVFEGERSYGGEIFKLEEHTDRLFFSAETLDMKIPFTREQINEACREALRRNGLVDAYVRPIAWRGSEMMAVSAQKTTIHVAIAVWQWPSYFDPEIKLKGIRLDMSEWRRPDPRTIPAKAKAAGLAEVTPVSEIGPYRFEVGEITKRDTPQAAVSAASSTRHADEGMTAS